MGMSSSADLKLRSPGASRARIAAGRASWVRAMRGGARGRGVPAKRQPRWL